MKYSYAFALAAAQMASAHTTFQSFVLNGEDQGQHTAVRTPSNGNNPIKDVTSSLMTCNGGTAAADTLEVAAGSEITFQWHHNDPATTSGDADEPIAASHKGPVMVYIAPADSDGEGAVWTKLYEDGLTDGTWGVDTFITNAGQITITLPDLAAGEYLIRPEIIALHEASTEGAAQFYNGCGQIKITGSGSLSLPTEGTDMTKAYSATDPGVLYNIYSGATTYTIPGPAVWDGASSSSDSGSTTPSSSTAAASSAASSAAATPSSAAYSSVAATSAVAEATPVSETPTSAAAATSAAATSAAPSPSATSGSSSSTLPENFTITEFIAWLKETTGTSSSKARRHARSFFG